MNSNKSTSIEDVARHAGVSTATVSRALRGLANVAPSTRAAVELAARELAYEANPNASRLATGRTMTVGVIAPYFGTWYVSQILTGVESLLRMGQYDLLVSSISRRTGPDEFASQIRSLARRVDGVITIDLYPSSPGRGELERLPVPLVCIGDRIEGRSHSMLDNVAAGRLAAEHFIELGHTRLAMIRGLDNGSPVESARQAAFGAALAKAGIEFGSTDVHTVEMSTSGGAEAARRLLDLEDRPTGVFCVSDEIAFGLLGTMWQRGISAPDDIAVIGVDGHELSDPLGVTTVQQNAASVGRWAARVLLDAIADPSAEPEARLEEPRLIVRASTVSP